MLVLKKPRDIPDYVQRSFYQDYFDVQNQRYLYSYIDESLSTDSYYKVITQVYRKANKRELERLEYSEISIDLPYGFTGYVRYHDLFFPTNKPCPDYPVYLPWHKYRWWVFQSGDPMDEGEVLETGGSDERSAMVVYPPKHIVSTSGCGCETIWRIPPAPEELPPEPGEQVPAPRANPPHFSETARAYNRYVGRYPYNSPLMRSLRITLDRLHIDPSQYDRDGWYKGYSTNQESHDEKMATMLNSRQDANVASQIRINPNSGSGRSAPDNGYSSQQTGSSTPSSYHGGVSYGPSASSSGNEGRAGYGYGAGGYTSNQSSSSGGGNQSSHDGHAWGSTYK